MKKKFEPEEVVPGKPIKIQKMTPTGQGIGEIENGDEKGKKIFFWNALPGENIKKYKTIKSKSHYKEAIAEETDDKNPERVEPKDEQFLSTSPWQIMSDSLEKETKLKIEHELFRNLWNNEIGFETDGKTYFYRNKMEYALYFDTENEKIELAVHPRGTHGKMPIKSSSIERPEIFKKAQEIVKNLNEKHEEARKYQSLLLRCNQDGKVEGGLYENHKPHPIFTPLEDVLLGVKYSYSPNGFFQINLPVYEKVLTKIKPEIKTQKVLDLYSGVGTIGLSVAADKDLTLVEVDGSAYRELEKNVANLGSPNVRPILAKSEDVLEYIEPDETVILDPPRAGCDKKLVEKLLEVGPEKIIYLSCNPITQVRDLEKLVEKYTIESVTVFNFFPKTPHIESLVILEK